MLPVSFTLSMHSCGTQKNQATIETPSNADVIPDTFQTAESEYQWLKVTQKPGFTIEKTWCFGTCPVYKMHIYENGFLYYEGIANVADTGIYYGRISQGHMRTLSETAKEIGFFEMKDVYDNPDVMDLPEVIISLKKGNESKMVRNRFDGPESLKLLEGSFEEILRQTKLTALTIQEK